MAEGETSLDLMLRLLLGEKWAFHWLFLLRPAEKEDVLSFCSAYDDPQTGFHDWCAAMNRRRLKAVLGWLKA